MQMRFSKQTVPGTEKPLYRAIGHHLYRYSDRMEAYLHCFDDPGARNIDEMIRNFLEGDEA